MTAATSVVTASVDTSVWRAPRLGVVRVHTGRGSLWLTGERTECPHLWITAAVAPVVSDILFEGGWGLTHEPTGYGVPGTSGLDVRQLRDVARLVADLDWSSADPGHFGHADRPHFARLREAIDRVASP